MNAKGSNQFETKYKYNFFTLSLWLFIALLIITGLLGHLHEATRKFISPIPNTGSLVKVVYAEANDIPSYIRQVFGKDADDALKIVGCESRFNPNAVGDNGRSIGLFQIHQSWYHIEPRFLKNPKINVQVAFQIFKESGYNWDRWSCNKVL